MSGAQPFPKLMLQLSNGTAVGDNRSEGGGNDAVKEILRDDWSQR